MDRSVPLAGLPGGLHARRSVGRAARLRQRILFVAGEYEGLIGVAPVARLHDECGSSDKTLDVLPVQHDYRDVPHQIEIVNRRIVDWLRR